MLKFGFLIIQELTKQSELNVSECFLEITSPMTDWVLSVSEVLSLSITVMPLSNKRTSQRAECISYETSLHKQCTPLETPSFNEIILCDVLTLLVDYIRNASDITKCHSRVMYSIHMTSQQITQLLTSTRQTSEENKTTKTVNSLKFRSSVSKTIPDGLSVNL